MKRSVFMALALAAFVSGSTLAHEGHEHRTMGKVVAIDDKKIEVESAEGKKVVGLLSADTKFLRDKTPAVQADVKVGARVVIVVVQEKGNQNAKQVLLGAAPAEHKH